MRHGNCETFGMKKIYLFFAITTISYNFSAQSGFCMAEQPDPPFTVFNPTMVKGDFNNDGFTDICAQGFVSASPAFIVSNLLSNGTGSYTSLSSFTINASASWTYLINLTVGDFDSDGNQDLIAVGDQDNAFFLLKGNGTGNFSSKTTYTTNGIPSTLIANDFNNDGKLDIAFSCAATNIVTFLYANGTGFLSPVNYTLPTSPKFFVASNFDSDTYLDLFVIAGNTSYFLKGSSSGTFAVSNGFALNSAFAIAVDVNSDNKTDLIYTDITTGSISVLKRSGNFTFNPAAIYAVSGSTNSVPLARIDAADFNNDGKIDLLSATHGNSICIFPGTSAGGFLSPINYSVHPMNGNHVNNFVVANINSDMKPDVVVLADDLTMPFGFFTTLVNCNTVEVGLDEKTTIDLNMRLFPNPANDFINLELPNELENEFISFSVFNSLGQVVKEEVRQTLSPAQGPGTVQSESMFKISTDGLPEGVYVLILTLRPADRNRGQGSIRSASKRFLISR